MQTRSETVLAVLRNVSDELFRVYEQTVDTPSVDEFLTFVAGGEL